MEKLHSFPVELDTATRRFNVDLQAFFNAAHYMQRDGLTADAGDVAEFAGHGYHPTDTSHVV